MKSACVAFLALAIFISSGTSHAASWTFENVEYHPFSPFWEYDTSIAVTSGGTPCIAYSESDVNRMLIYATKKQTGWIKETVDTGDNGYYPSLILDPSGRPHISYSIHDNLNIKKGIKYTFKDGGNWNTEMANSITRIDYSSLGLCASGPCMSYTYVENDSLQYSFKQGGGWLRKGLEPPPEYPSQEPYSSLVVDNEDTSHIVYQEHSAGELWHAKGKGLNWLDYECVDPDGWIGCSTSCLKCDSSGRLHLSYIREIFDGVFNVNYLYYAYRDNSGWHEELVDDHTSGYHSLALDPSGRPHIAYFGSEPPNAQKLKYAYKDGTGWHVEYVEEGFGYTFNPNHIVSLAVDSSNKPHISCDSNFGLLYGTRPGIPIGTPTPTPIPQAKIVLNGSSFRVGDQLTATFQLNRSIARPFTAFAVVILPSRAMLNVLTLDTPLAPVATNVPGLTITDDPFTFPLINTMIPAGAPLGNYEILVAFFVPGVPITGRGDAFLEVSAPFTIEQ